MITTDEQLKKINTTYITKYCPNIKTVLDLGSGTNAHTPERLMQFYDLKKYVAVDKGQLLGHRIKNKDWFEFYGKGITTYFEDVEEKKFDLVMLSKVLNCNKGQEKIIIQQAISMLNNGGFLYLRFNGQGYESLVATNKVAYSIEQINSWILGCNVIFGPYTIDIAKTHNVEEYIIICRT